MPDNQGITDITDTAAVIDRAIELADRLLEASHSPKAQKARVIAPLAPKLTRILKARWKAEKKKLLASSAIKGLAGGAAVKEADAADEDRRRKRNRRAVEAAILLALGASGKVSSTEAAAWDGATARAFSGGSARLQTEVGKTVEVPESYEARYLRTKGFRKIAGGLDETTRERVASKVADVYEAGGTYEDIVDAIEGVFDKFEAYRLDSIASYELSDAYHSGRKAAANELGMTHKEWDPDGEACAEICQPNADQGPIPIDEDFESGDEAPPAHNFCDCGANYFIIEKDESED